MMNILPPQEPEVEMAVLGAMLTDPTAVDDVSTILKPDHLYREPHRRIFKAILSVHQSGVTADVITVGDHLKKDGHLATVGGHTYLTECAGRVLSSANVTHHATILLEKALNRGMIEKAQWMITEAAGGHHEALNLLGQAQHALDELANISTFVETYTPADLAPEMLKLIDQRHKEKPALIGIPSGLKALDMITSGFQPSLEYLVGAPTGTGKTAFILNCALHAVTAAQKRVLIFSLEMKRKRLMFRLLGMASGVDHTHIERGQMGDGDWLRFTQRSADILMNDRLVIVDAPCLPIAQICAVARRVHRERPVDMIIIDYIQLMEWDGDPSVNRYLQLAGQNKRILHLAKQLDVPILAVVQLNEAGHARESMNLEQDTDFFLVLQAENPKAPKDRFPLICEMMKHRDATTERIKINFNMQTQKMTDGDAEEY